MKQIQWRAALCMAACLTGCGNEQTSEARDGGGEVAHEQDAAAPPAGDGDDTRPGDGDQGDGDQGDGDDDLPDGSNDHSAPLPLDGFAHARRVSLDTTPGGADVSDDVPNYPLALRLDAASFDFAQAREHGEDLRFTREDGSPLPHSVEAWEAGEQWAALWVKVDVRGNSKDQSFVMHWGNPAAEAMESSHDVFSTADGFIGVFHLGDDAGNQEGGFKDSTDHAAHATGVHLEGGASAPGRIGNALSLEHSKKQWLELEGDKNALFDVYDHLTFSIWTYARTHGVEYQCAFSKGEQGFRFHYYGIDGWDDNKGKHIVEMCTEQEGGEDFCPIHEDPSQGSDVAPGKWFHWLGVSDYPRVTLYLNGVEEASEESDVAFTSGASVPVMIGTNSTFAEGRSWDGLLDEARVMAVSKGPSWAKLEYESQREDQALVHYGAVSSR